MTSAQQSTTASGEVPSEGVTTPDGSGQDAWQGRAWQGRQQQEGSYSAQQHSWPGNSWSSSHWPSGGSWWTGKAHGSDREHQVGVGTTGVTLGPVGQGTSSGHRWTIVRKDIVETQHNL